MKSNPCRGVAVLSLGLAAGAAMAATCPGDEQARDASTLLVVRLPGRPPRAYAAADLAQLPQARFTQRTSVSAPASAPAAGDRSIAWGGVLLRDLLGQAGYGGAEDRSARFTWIEAMATDGYRAVFSWGEIFNASGGDQTLVITAQDGVALDAAAGPLALRALSDWRPGPRHVRNLCALVVHGP